MTATETTGIAKGAFKSVFDIIGGLATAKPYADSQGILANLMKTVTAIYGDYSAIKDENDALKKELANIKDFRAEREKYRATNEDSGVVTFALKQPADETEAAHRFCPNCFKRGLVRYLQPANEESRIVKGPSGQDGVFALHRCQECGSTVQFGFSPYNAPPMDRGGDGSWAVQM